MEKNELNSIEKSLQNCMQANLFDCIIDKVEKLPVDLQFNEAIKELYLEANFQYGFELFVNGDGRCYDYLLKSVKFSENRQEAIDRLISYYCNPRYTIGFPRCLSDAFFERGTSIMQLGSHKVSNDSNDHLGMCQIHEALDYYELAFDIWPEHPHRKNEATNFFMQSIYFAKVSRIITDNGSDEEIHFILKRMSKYVDFESCINYSIMFLTLMGNWDRGQRFVEVVLKYYPDCLIALKSKYKIEGNLLYQKALNNCKDFKPDLSIATEVIALMDKSIKVLTEGLNKYPDFKDLDTKLAEVKDIKTKLEFVIHYADYVKTKDYNKVLKVLEIWIEIDKNAETPKAEHARFCDIWVEELKLRNVEQGVIDGVLKRKESLAFYK